MQFIYRKPKNAEELISILKKTNTIVNWQLADESDLERSQKFFDIFSLKNMAMLIFSKSSNALIGVAILTTSGKIVIYDKDYQNITDSFSKIQLQEIDVYLRQIELF